MKKMKKQGGEFSKEMQKFQKRKCTYFLPKMRENGAHLRPFNIFFRYPLKGLVGKHLGQNWKKQKLDSSYYMFLP